MALKPRDFFGATVPPLCSRACLTIRAIRIARITYRPDSPANDAVYVRQFIVYFL
jgi:hypothetical protein